MPAVRETVDRVKAIDVDQYKWRFSTEIESERAPKGDRTAEAPNRPEISAEGTLPAQEIERLTDDIIAALKTVYDPEIPADIYELGLIYRVDIADDRSVSVDMTLTAPACPVAGEMPKWVQDAVEAVAGVQSAAVNMVFDPPWDQSRMSDEARMALDMW
jgi:FeS assembly SUF system protein